ncbi:unnamed protein product, partial [Protopolystoma xenopodis]
EEEEEEEEEERRRRKGGEVSDTTFETCGKVDAERRTHLADRRSRSHSRVCMVQDLMTQIDTRPHGNCTCPYCQAAVRMAELRPVDFRSRRADSLPSMPRETSVNQPVESWHKRFLWRPGAAGAHVSTEAGVETASFPVGYDPEQRLEGQSVPELEERQLRKQQQQQKKQQTQPHQQHEQQQEAQTQKQVQSGTGKLGPAGGAAKGRFVLGVRRKTSKSAAAAAAASAAARDRSSATNTTSGFGSSPDPVGSSTEAELEDDTLRASGGKGKAKRKSDNMKRRRRIRLGHCGTFLLALFPWQPPNAADCYSKYTFASSKIPRKNVIWETDMVFLGIHTFPVTQWTRGNVVEWLTCQAQILYYRGSTPAVDVDKAYARSKLQSTGAWMRTTFGRARL